MKILILGCGTQGSSIAALLAKEEDVESLICADMDLKAAKRAAEWVKALKSEVEVRAEQAKASKREDVARVAKGVDIIFNATFPEFNIPVLEACLDVGAHYLDLGGDTLIDELDQAEEGQSELDARLKDAGVTALINMGVSPGFTCIAAHYIVDQLDTIDAVKIRWCDKVDATQLVGTWSPAGYMEEFFSPYDPEVWDKGIKSVDLLGNAEEYEFPEPVGRVTLYNVTHNEIYTIPRYLPKVTGKPIDYVDVKGGMVIGALTVKDVLIEAIRQANKKRMSTYVEKADLLKLWGSSFIHPMDFRESYDKGIIKDACVAIATEVIGYKSGKQVRHTVYCVTTLGEAIKHVPWATPLSYATSTSATIATLMIGRGKIKRRGIMLPEWIEQPKAFIKKMENMGNLIRETIDKPIF